MISPSTRLGVFKIPHPNLRPWTPYDLSIGGVPGDRFIDYQPTSTSPRFYAYHYTDDTQWLAAADSLGASYPVHGSPMTKGEYFNYVVRRQIPFTKF